MVSLFNSCNYFNTVYPHINNFDCQLRVICFFNSVFTFIYNFPLDCAPVMSGDQRTVIKGNPSQYVKLNCGGSLYYTTIGTLTKIPDTMLQAMFSGRMEVLTDPEGKEIIK